MKSTMMFCPLLLGSMLDRAAKLFPEATIVAIGPDGGRRSYTYGDLRGRSRQLASALQGAGIVKGDRVATLMWNTREHLEAYYGVPATGAVLHTLNLRLHPDELSYVVNHAQDRFLIVDSVLLDVFERIRSRVRFERVFVVDSSGGGLVEGTESYAEFLSHSNGEVMDAGLSEEDAAAMCYTSGTTGCPKGVLYSHRAIALHSLAVSLPDQLNISRNDTVLPIVPMFHANAWGFPYAATMNGSRQVLCGRNLQPKVLLDEMQEEQVTIATAVPTVLMSVLNTLESDPGRWKLAAGLRLFVGGSAAPEVLFRRFDKLGVSVVQAWGMTETTPVGTACTLKPHMHGWPEEDRYALRAKQGLPLPFIEARIVDEKGEAAKNGKSAGELQVRGPWVAGSYYRLDQQDRWTDDGWFCTGDVATIDAEGYVKITDRLKDLIKSGGEWISSVELENALLGHAAVKEAAVIAIPHPRWQERPLALVVLHEGSAVEPAELHAWLAPKFPRWHLPDAFVFVDQLAHTSTGKLQKNKLRQDFQDWRKEG
jgi:fatty-acyl-CoA synthase